MSTSVRFTAEQFDRVMDGAVFRDDPDRRFELILGEIREMVHPGPLHENIIDLLAEWSFANVDTRKIRVRIEKTLGIPELDTVPRPDLAWVNQQDYSGARPSVRDVLLLIEVADTTLAFDTGEKLLIYAKAGIKEYWVVDGSVDSRKPSLIQYVRRGKKWSMTIHPFGSTFTPKVLPGFSLVIDPRQ